MLEKISPHAPQCINNFSELQRAIGRKQCCCLDYLERATQRWAPRSNLKLSQLPIVQLFGLDVVEYLDKIQLWSEMRHASGGIPAKHVMHRAKVYVMIFHATGPDKLGMGGVNPARVRKKKCDVSSTILRIKSTPCIMEDNFKSSLPSANSFHTR